MKSAHSIGLALALVAAAAQATDAPKPVVTPQVNAIFRVLRTDASTVIGQAVVSANGTAATTTINVRQADALVAANGRCAFDVKVDEVSTTARTGTVNRLYSNDVLVAQNTGIDLQAGVLHSSITQPYLFPGLNNLRIVLDAEGKTPTTGWVRINVDGTCKAPATTTPPKTTAPPPPPITPTSAQWQPMFNAWGYSNYGVTQLRGKGYAHYDDLVHVNADLGSAVAAKQIAAAAYAPLMARWNAIANDPAFKAAMAAIVPTGDKK